MRDVYNHDIGGVADNPLSNQIEDALKHYDDIASKAHHWMSIIPQALKSYNPEKDQQIKDQQELIEAALLYIEESPCDPDITPKQLEAYHSYKEKLTTYKNKYQ